MTSRRSGSKAGLGRTARAGLCALALAGAALPPSVRADEAPRTVRQVLESRALATVDGKALAWPSLRGEVVVVTFWASWCKPCRREMPALDALHREMAGRGGRVVAVSIDEDPANVRRFARSLGLGLPIYRDGPDGLARTLDLEAIPTTFVLDRAGAVALRTTGAGKADLEKVTAVTRRLLATRLSADGQSQ